MDEPNPYTQNVICDYSAQPRARQAITAPCPSHSFARLDSRPKTALLFNGRKPTGGSPLSTRRNLRLIPPITYPFGVEMFCSRPLTLKRNWWKSLQINFSKVFHFMSLKWYNSRDARQRTERE
jgi:hypothetical protein